MASKDTDKDSPKKRVSRKRVSKKSTNKSESSSKSSEFSDTLEDSVTNSQIDKALKTILAEHANKKNLTKKNIQILHSFIEEYLSTFIILGYTYEGDPVTLVSALNQRDADSLSTFLQKFIMKNISPPGMGPPGLDL